jgi:hypothetical protein
VKKIQLQQQKTRLLKRIQLSQNQVRRRNQWHGRTGCPCRYNRSRRRNSPGETAVPGEEETSLKTQLLQEEETTPEDTTTPEEATTPEGEPTEEEIIAPETELAEEVPPPPEEETVADSHDGANGQHH